jgi:hypothetical protein
MDDAVMQTNIRLRSFVCAKAGSHEIKKMEFELFVGLQGLERFVIHENEKLTHVNLVSGR